MITVNFDEAFSSEWVRRNITDSTNELVVLRQVIPWQKISNKLTSFYHKKGRNGKSLRMMVALLIISRLRALSDENVIKQVKENRYIQYFCNVGDKGLQTFLNPSSLCTFRKRLGAKGVSVIESIVFDQFRRVGVIENDDLLMDSTVLESNIIYPTDVLLLHKAFGKMEQFAVKNDIPIWWDAKYLKKLRRAFNLAKKNQKISFLWDFYLLFCVALKQFRIFHESVCFSEKELQRYSQLVELLSLLEVQTEHKIAGKVHIENRIVSLDEVDARPIKKGKSHPTCEFGTTLQISFNRAGFMITTENYIGKPNDKTLFLNTLEYYRERMKVYPEGGVTDLGYRSRKNFKKGKEKLSCLFMGRSEDVPENLQRYYQKARSATEGFIAVAKNWRGFDRSRYRGLNGDKVWTILSQLSYNLKKFIQLDRAEEIKEESLLKLGLYG